MAGHEPLSTSEHALARLAVGGSRAAFESLVRRSARAVYAELLVQTRDPHLAEDLTQETFLRAWRAVGGLSEPEKFRPWLMSIARTALLDGAKASRRAKRGGGRDPSEFKDAATTAAPPDELLVRREQADRALRRLAELPERYRQPLTLRFLEGADYAEICTSMGVTGGALRGLLTRGLEMLRATMADDDAPARSKASDVHPGLPNA